MAFRELTFDCLIIGSGIAGLSAALEMQTKGVSCAVITCAPQPSEANTNYAQGGIIYEALAPNSDTLIHDILEAGAYTNYLPAVEQLAKRGPELVKRILLDTVGVPFERDETEVYRRTREGGHQENRILYQGDETGKSIQTHLLQYLDQCPRVRFLSGMTAVNLLMTSYHNRDRAKRHGENRCFGAFVFDQKTKEVFPIFASHTIIATGGVGQLYLHNTNSKFARGDGLALAHRAGCRLENLEYIQFHPTTFYHPKSRRFLISEALRGEGGILVNQHGERFLTKYIPGHSHPELASRDKVAKAIHQEMLSTGAPCVYLDISHKPAAWIQQRFPFVYRSALQQGIDITQQPIPVVPGAHYHCGGIWSDLDGRTSIPHLWAVGEAASTGLHGANRLASTSLLEGLVWGTAAGEAIASELKEHGTPEFPGIDPWRHETVTVDPAFLSQDWLTLKQTMWNYVGLIKTDLRLKRAEGILTELSRGIDMFYRKAVLSDELIGLQHASLASHLILEACQRNPRSLGCYLREELEI